MQNIASFHRRRDVCDAPESRRRSVILAYLAEGAESSNDARALAARRMSAIVVVALRAGRRPANRNNSSPIIELVVEMHRRRR
jgi:hypothetical protein